MVLRTFNLSIFEIAKWIAAIMTIAAALWAPGAIIGTALWFRYGEEAINHLGIARAEDISRIEQTLVGVERAIVVLSRPDEIVHYRDLPAAANDWCAPGEPCPITIFAERDIRAIDCRIVPQSTELLIQMNGREYVATVAPNRPGTNLGTAPRALEPTFLMPEAIPAGVGRAIIRSSYSSCPWQIAGQPPATQESPSFSLEIRE